MKTQLLKDEEFIIETSHKHAVCLWSVPQRRHRDTLLSSDWTMNTHTHTHAHTRRMAAVSFRRCRTPRTFITFLFVLSAGGQFSSVSCFKVAEGGVASLSCQYSVKRFGLSRVCWGRGCGTFWCNNILVQTDEHGVVSKVEDRYRLTGDVLDGQMDLDILNVRRTDSGPYCCRVDVDGLFNDKKVIMNLRVVKGAFASSPPPTTTSAATTSQVTEPSASTVNWKSLLSSQLDLLRRNSTQLRSNTDTDTVEDSLSSLSLQINVPVLSLSLSLLLILVAVFLFLAFKRGMYRRALKNGCFSSEEPPHIIYEIRMRRPVQENIYTLD